MTVEDKYVVMSADIEVTCGISQLLNSVSVQWRDSDEQIISDDDYYTTNQGSKDESGNQHSTLTISHSKLQALGSSSFTYSCQVLSGDQTVAITKNMTLTLYDFG